MSNSSGFGILPSGFVPKLQADCMKDITDAMRSNVDPNVDMSAKQPIGQMGAAQASENAALWELGGVLWSGLDPNNAQGFVLDADCAYTGTLRDEETFSTVIGTMSLNSSSAVPAGSIASVSGQPTNQWELLGPADPTKGVQTGTGPVVSTTAGTYYGWFQATLPGPQLANAGQLTVITTAVSGWTAITNADGCTLGSNVESDSSFNVRREQELAASGGATAAATRAAILVLKTGSGAQAVAQAFVFENDKDVVDANGVPPHSIHTIIYDGVTPLATNLQVAQAIWANKPSGTATFGSTSAIVLDSTGTQQTVYFDRAVITPVYLSLTTTRGAAFDPVNGPSAIKAALVAYWRTQMGLGVPMIARFISGSINNLDIQGLSDVPTFTLGLTYNPVTTANVPCTQLQILTLNTGVDGSSQQFILVDGA